jgi:hypothetical protein
MLSITKSRRALALLMALAFAFSATANAKAVRPPECFGDWAAAAAVVAREDLVTVEKLTRQFERMKLGRLVKVELCRESGRFIYRAVIRDPHGRFRSTAFDARLGIEIGVAGTVR